MRWFPPLLIACTLLSPGAPGQTPPGAAPDTPGVVVTGKIGSKTNPVRCDGAQGQRDYLSRLRDYSDHPVTFKRAGTLRDGPYGNPLDAYQVSYSDGYSKDVYLDMYHPGYSEKEAPSGFKIVPPEQEPAPAPTPKVAS